ncbi:MAG: HNH endonuclease signature motif containing protein [Erythrobacter sp.]
MSLVETVDQVISNAFVFVDALQDEAEFRTEALHLTSAGRVYLPFRNGEGLSFAPAKFIGYRNNDFDTYRIEVNERSGGTARAAISRVYGFDAQENDDLERQLENYCDALGVPLHNNRHSFWLTEDATRGIQRDRSAIADYDSNAQHNDDPEYRKRMAGSYVRNQKVRNAVLARAGGKCEYCQEVGFRDIRGKSFLEAHHVIALSEQGVDKTTNVIALCPNHHREAHFGSQWQGLQDQFLKILKKLDL